MEGCGRGKERELGARNASIHLSVATCARAIHVMAFVPDSDPDCHWRLWALLNIISSSQSRFSVSVPLLRTSLKFEMAVKRRHETVVEMSKKE